MALLGIEVPDKISEMLNQVIVSGHRDKSDHLTMFYFDGELDVPTISKICKIISPIISKQEPFDLTIKKITSFPKGEYGFPIKGDVISNDLIKLRKKIATAFNKNKIDFSKEFPDFKPHITLSYSDEDFKEKKLNKPITWTNSHIVLWGGTSEIPGIEMVIPFGLKISKADILYSVSRLLIKNNNL